MISIARTSRLATAHIRATVLPSSVACSARNPYRPLHSTNVSRQPYKDDQDRESLKPRSKENTRSSSDGEIAESHGDAAFNPNKTSPEEAKDTAGADTEGNPLEVSGANQEMSKPQGDKAEGESRGGEGAGKQRASGGVTPKKHGKAT
jgi:hypothetical protein